jgi:subtilisin family serine protease
MKQPHIILENDLKVVDLKYWEGKPLNSYFDKLKSFLSYRKGELFANLLTEPNIRKGGDRIRWIATSSASKVYPLSEASDEDLLENGKELLQELSDFASRLEKSRNEEDKGWGRLLSYILKGVSVSVLYTDGIQFFLPSWGVDTLSESGDGEFTTGFTPPVDQTAADGGSLSDIPENPEVVSEKGKQGQEEVSPPEDIPPEVSNVQKPELSSTDTTPESENINEGQDDPSADQMGSTDATGGGDKGNGGGGWFTGNWWKWLLGLLALILLLIWIRGCEKEPPLLPADPVLPPVVDSTSIGYDRDSLAYIVKNKINIVISGDQTIEEFARAFDEVYPDRQKYKIVYFGEESIKRIQIEVPEEERDELINKIPEQFPDFNLLVYQEGLFESNTYPSDPFFSNNDFKWYFDAVNAPLAWNKSWGDDQMIVAILDDGFDLRHNEFAGKVVKPFNVYTGTTNVFSGRGGKHGTHVAGTAVGSRENAAGLSGIAPDCLLMPVRVADNRGVMSQTAVVDGILYAINQGADVINMSLGMMVPPHIAALPVSLQRDIAANSMKAEEAFWRRLFQIANDNNVTVVLAGGNQNVLIGLDPMARSGLTINVSAVGKRNQKASFSNFGDLSTVSAPGVEIYNSVPNNRYEFLQGTSMAAPIVTGGVALLKSVNPQLTNEEVADILVNTGIPLAGDIGPLLQLDRALGIIDSTGVNIPRDEECDDIKNQVDSLLAELERLRELCPDAFQQDTMQIPEVIEDLNFSLGVWESTTYLRNDSNEKVTIRFEFRADETGTLNFIEENGLVFGANLSLSHTRNTFIIDQLDKARSPSSNREYYQYLFNCRADAKGRAACQAQNKMVRANKFNFRLIKIK